MPVTLSASKQLAATLLGSSESDSSALAAGAAARRDDGDAGHGRGRRIETGDCSALKALDSRAPAACSGLLKITNANRIS